MLALHMTTLERLAKASVSVLLVGLWIWSVWILAPTAGALGAWDVICVGMLDASAVMALLWFLAQREKRGSNGFFVCARILAVLFLSAALYGVHRRSYHAEIELRVLGIEPEKANYSGRLAWMLRKLGLQPLVKTGRWVSNGPRNDVEGQHRLSRLAQLLTICGVKELGLYQEGRLTDIRPLRRLRDLRRLSLRCSPETDYRSLAELPELTLLYLDIRDSKPDLSHLQDAPKLETLHIDTCRATVDLSALKAPPNLQALHLTGFLTPKDGAFLPSSKTLRKLSIKDALTLERFTAAGAMPNLTELTLNQGYWKVPWKPDLSEVPRFAPNLSHLAIEGMEIENISGLTNLPRLASLQIIECDAPQGFSGFPRMPALKTLLVRNSPFVTIASFSRVTPNLSSLRVAQGRSLMALDALGSLTNLEHLDVRECLLTDLDEHLEELGKIRDVWLPLGSNSAKK